MCMVEAGSRVIDIHVIQMDVTRLIVQGTHVVKAMMDPVKVKVQLILARDIAFQIMDVVHTLVVQAIMSVIAMVDIVVAIAEETVTENVAAYVQTDADLEIAVKENLWKLSSTQTNDYLQLWGARIISHQ